MAVFDRQVFCPGNARLLLEAANAGPRLIETPSKRTWLSSLSKYQIVQKKRRGSVSATGATPYSNVTDSSSDVARLAF